MDDLKINIGLFGSVSVGKSTFINAIAGKQYSDAEIKKTTMVPQIYTESIDYPPDSYTIRKINRMSNEEILKMIEENKLNILKCKPIYHKIDRIEDLFDPAIIDPRLKFDIYDIPGLNDSASKHVYFEWVKQNIKIFDIIIFMTDITKGLNNSDEIEILNLLISSLTKSKAAMVCFINKCDDIYFDADQNDLVFEEEEQENIYIQANTILKNIAKKYGFDDTESRITPFLPISSENCFIYRTLMKDPNYDLDNIHKNILCKNEYGSNKWKKISMEQKECLFKDVLEKLSMTYNSKILDTGYQSMKTIIQNTIIANKVEFIKNHLNQDMKDLVVKKLDDVTQFIDLVVKYNNQLEQVESLLGQISYETFWKNVITSITNYTNFVVGQNTKIVRYRDFIEFTEFDNLHSQFQNHCLNFMRLSDVLKKIKDYPNDFMEQKYALFVGKLLNIYDQLNIVDPDDQIHILPSNLLFYLKIINIHAPKKFDTYAYQFLNLCSKNKKIKNFLVPKIELEMVNLVEYIANHTKSYISLVQQISIILTNKLVHYQLLSKPIDQVFNYLVKMKKLVKQAIKSSKEDADYHLNILACLIDKNISLMFSVNNVTCLYKQEIDYQKICSLISAVPTTETIIDTAYEKRLLDLLTEPIEIVTI